MGIRRIEKMHTGVWIIVIGSFAEHLFYSCVCLFPAWWDAMSLSPVHVHSALVVFKTLQLTPFVYGYDQRLIEPSTLSAVGWFLMAGGQCLNISVYNCLGFDGVYYGRFLSNNTQVRWVTDFPYNMPIAHPQYIGALMTYIGIWMAFVRVYDARFLKYSSLMALSYTLMSLVENTAHQ